MPLSVFRVVLFLLLVTAPVLAHEGADGKIERLSEQLVEVGDDAGLRLKRADAWRRAQRWEEAFADLTAAESLDPSLPGLHLARGRLLIDVRWWPAARVCLQRHMEREGVDANVLGLAADAALGAGDVDDALRLRAQSLALDGQASPELWLKAAEEVLTAGGRTAEARTAAVAVIDAGVARLGPVVSLQLRAVELDRADGRWDAALARLETVTDASPRKESWLARRGDLLSEAGRPAAAADAWRAARSALDTLKPHRRETALIAELEAHLDAVLAEAHAPETPSPGADP